MSGRLIGKKALIYGGGTGIGFACAEAMAREGPTIFISSRRDPILRDAVEKLEPLGKAGFEAGDATIDADVQRITAAAQAFLGGVDTLVVSAGAGGRTPVFDTDPDEFQRIMDNTLRPVFLAVHYVVRSFLRLRKASVIIISSSYGLVGHRERLALIAAPRSGVIGMAMALDFADRGVQVNVMCPGYVETPLAIEVAKLEPDPEATLKAKCLMHPIPRAGRLDEMGELAAYLASDLAAFVTGQAIAIDGGYSVR